MRYPSSRQAKRPTNRPNESANDAEPYGFMNTPAPVPVMRRAGVYPKARSQVIVAVREKLAGNKWAPPRSAIVYLVEGCSQVVKAAASAAANSSHARR